METKKNKIHFLPSVIIFVLAMLVVVFLFTKSMGSVDSDGGQTLKIALDNSAVLCYSLEGYYPPTLEYLTDNYGVIVDQEHYIVDYEVFATNIKPEIRVMVK